MADKRINDFVAKTFGDQAKICYEFPVLHHEWETDGFAYLVDSEGAKKVVMTDHGSPFVATEDHLDERLLFYQNVVAATNIAKDLLKL